jgi:hypothetical protein
MYASTVATPPHEFSPVVGVWKMCLPYDNGDMAHFVKPNQTRLLWLAMVAERQKTGEIIRRRVYSLSSLAAQRAYLFLKNFAFSASATYVCHGKKPGAPNSVLHDLETDCAAHASEYATYLAETRRD